MKTYRPNVAAIVQRADGKILICERLHIPGAWQFPQGGVDEGETALEALEREVFEEVGYATQHYCVVDEKGPYLYDYPPEVVKRKKRNFLGQKQTYFLLRLLDGAPEPDISQQPREFSSYRWIEPKSFDLEWLPQFKRDVYRQVLQDFFAK